MSNAYSLRSTPQRRVPIKRTYRTIVLGLMAITSTIAMFDLYLFATSGFH